MQAPKKHDLFLLMVRFSPVLSPAGQNTHYIHTQKGEEPLTMLIRIFYRFGQALPARVQTLHGKQAQLPIPAFNCFFATICAYVFRCERNI